MLEKQTLFLETNVTWDYYFRLSPEALLEEPVLHWPRDTCGSSSPYGDIQPELPVYCSICSGRLHLNSSLHMLQAY